MGHKKMAAGPGGDRADARLRKLKQLLEERLVYGKGSDKRKE